jgi:PmbA protein
MQNSMIDQMRDLAQQGLGLAKSLGAGAAGISFNQTEAIACAFDGGKLKATDTAQRVSYSVTVIKDGRRGSAGGNDLAALDEMIRRAVTLAANGGVAHFEAFPGPAPVAKVQRHDPQTAQLPPERFIDAGRQVIDAIKSRYADAHIAFEAGREETETLLATSGGVCLDSRGTKWGQGGYVQLTNGTDMQFAGKSRSWRSPNDLMAPANISDCILEDLDNGRRIASARPGKSAAFLAPEIVGMLLHGVMLGVNGRNVAKGDSPLRGRLGERVLDPVMTIIDDPHVNYHPDSAIMDDDGVPTQMTSIFDHGVLQSFLYDLDTAGLASAGPTGNRGCRPYSLTIPGGALPGRDLMRGVSEGLYIKQLLGFGQSNLINGDFSCNVGAGYKIENGQIVGRVKNTMVAGNIYELLANNVQVGSDIDPVDRLPHLLIEGLSVTV